MVWLPALRRRAERGGDGHAVPAVAMYFVRRAQGKSCAAFGTHLVGAGRISEAAHLRGLDGLGLRGALLPSLLTAAVDSVLRQKRGGAVLDGARHRGSIAGRFARAHVGRLAFV